VPSADNSFGGRECLSIHGVILDVIVVSIVGFVVLRIHVHLFDVVSANIAKRTLGGLIC
jgi:hypothetical protein